MNPILILPASLLPSAKEIPLETLESLGVLIRCLRFLYNPEVRGSRQRQNFSYSNERITSAVAHIPTRPDRLRTDSLERAHFIKRLTVFVSALYAADDDETTRVAREK